ncbi:MAG: hypothetical protein Q4D88_04680 [Anaerococcus sp.]|nr:hypothetical protein [Anaerococcus sp.]
MAKKDIPKFDQWVKTAYNLLEEFAEGLDEDEKKALEKNKTFKKYKKKNKEKSPSKARPKAKESLARREDLSKKDRDFTFNQGGDFEGDTSTLLRNERRKREKEIRTNLYDQKNKAKRARLRKALIYSEILDKPLALRKKK